MRLGGQFDVKASPAVLGLLKTHVSPEGDQDPMGSHWSQPQRLGIGGRPHGGLPGGMGHVDELCRVGLGAALHDACERDALFTEDLRGGCEHAGAVRHEHADVVAGLEIGDVLALWRNRVAKAYDADLRRVEVPIPDERYAVAFVFRTFDHVAYALVMSASKSVRRGDIVRNP